MRVVVDGNNLLFAAQEHLPAPAVGRERLCALLGRWGAGSGLPVLVVFDGGSPGEAFARQMRFTGVEVRFSEARSADDVIEEIIERSLSPTGLWIITGDRAIQSVARRYRCRCTSSKDFVIQLNPAPTSKPEPAPQTQVPDAASSNDDPDHWLRSFGYDPDEPSDETDLMGPVDR